MAGTKKKIYELDASASILGTYVLPVSLPSAGNAKKGTIDQVKTYVKTGMVASDITDFDTEVANNTAVSNATSHIANTGNPHSVTKTQVGLANVANVDTTTTANITDSLNKRFVTDTEKTIISNTSGTNTGDQTISDATITLTDITTNNANSARHGFLPKLANTGTKYLRDDGTWNTVSGGSGDVTGPASSVANNVPKFADTSGKVISDGYGVTNTIGSPGSASNLATEQAVRAAISTAGGGDVSGPSSSTDNALARFDSTTGKLIQNGTITEDDTGNLGGVNAIQMATNPTIGAHSPGKFYRDTVHGTMSVMMDNGVTLQLGQENQVKVYNNTGVTISNGKMVYIAGMSGETPLVELAKADAIATCMTIGMATEDIAQGSYGKITRFGIVHDLNTTTYSSGQKLYLSAATAGNVTNTAPTSPNIAIMVGTVGEVNVTTGSILVDISCPLSADVYLSADTNSVAPSQKAVKTYIDQRWIDVNRYGFVPGQTTLTFNGTNTVTVTPISATWSYYRSGMKYEITGAKSVTIPGSPVTTGLYFIYIDGTDGTLAYSTNAWTLNDTKVTVAILYFNDALTPKFIFGDERHTCLIDRREHMYNHYTSGTRHSSGGELTGYTLNTATDAGNTFGISTANIFDEDIYMTLSQLTDTNGTTSNYFIPYRSGVGTWLWKSSDMPFSYTGTNPYNYVQYDNAGTLTDAVNNRRVNYYLIETNGRDASETTQLTSTSPSRFCIIPGRAAFTSAAAAYAEDYRSFDMSGFTFTEGVFVKQITLNTSGVANTVKGRCMIDRVQTISSSISSQSGSVSTPHDGLAGLNLAGTGITYGHIDDQAQTIYGAKTFNSDVVVPAEAYGSGWNGSNEVPTKNDVYDQIETLPTATSTTTLTNKRITPRTGTTTSAANPTINTDNVDMYIITAQTEAIASFTTNLSGTPTQGQKLWISITGTAARAITWGDSFEASTVALPTTTVSTNRLDVGFVWNTVTSRWRCVAAG